MASEVRRTLSLWLPIVVVALALLCSGCARIRKPTAPTGQHYRILTYNVNRGSDPKEIAEVIRRAGADIVCLQETDDVEADFKAALASEYPTMAFRDSETRVGGGFAFLSKYPAREVAWIPSETEWFAGWILEFETPTGPVQVLNVHLRPPIKGRRSFVKGYLFSRGDRLREVEFFYSKRDAKTPLIVAGDFNDTAGSRAGSFLKRKGLTNALPEFDRRTPTWKWRSGWLTLRRRMDHIFYSSDLECFSARVIEAGPSDHFPVEGIFAARR